MEIRTRFVFVALALSTIAVGLGLHWGGSAFPPALRDVVGDALWAVMMTWWVGAIVPDSRVVARACAAVAICWTVEFSQFFHAPLIDGWRRTTLGQLVLGTAFDPRDLAAYTAGVLAAVVLEYSARRWFASSKRGAASYR